MKTKYFTSKFIERISLESRPEEENGFDYEQDDTYDYITNGNESDAGAVSIDTLIATLQSLKEKGANYVACDWHCDHGELDVYGLDFKASSDVEIKEFHDAILVKKELLKQRQIKEMETKLASLRSS